VQCVSFGYTVCSSLSWRSAFEIDPYPSPIHLIVRHVYIVRFGVPFSAAFQGSRPAPDFFFFWIPDLNGGPLSHYRRRFRIHKHPLFPFSSLRPPCRTAVLFRSFFFLIALPELFYFHMQLYCSLNTRHMHLTLFFYSFFWLSCRQFTRPSSSGFQFLPTVDEKIILFASHFRFVRRLEVLAISFPAPPSTKTLISRLHALKSAHSAV